MRRYREAWPEFDVERLHDGRQPTWTGIGRWDNLDLLAQLDPSVRRAAFAEAAAALVAAESSEGA